MSNKTSHPMHVQNLNSLKNYIKNIDSHLNQLSHTIGADLKGLGTSLHKGALHPKKYLPHPRKTSMSFEQALYKGLLGGNLGTSSSGSSIYRTSSGQIWAQIAAQVSKAMGRGL